MRKPGGGRTPRSPRLVFEAIVYVLRTGRQWKGLPRERFGSVSAIMVKRPNPVLRRNKHLCADGVTPVNRHWNVTPLFLFDQWRSHNTPSAYPTTKNNSVHLLDISFSMASRKMTLILVW